MENNRIPSINFHLWEPCNMRCEFCFATFQDVKKTILPKGHLPKNEAIEIIKQIANFGFQKITFAGGEPTLCPWLPELIKIAKELGLTTTLITNGSELTDSFLENNKNYLDWIAISIDSLKRTTNQLIGRKMAGNKTLSESYYLSVINKIKKYNYGLKINTVVNAINCKEDLTDFIKKAKPKRWKVLQVLPIKGQNDDSIELLKITNLAFNLFIQNHQEIETIVTENNNEMKDSYVMVDPAGRFFINTKGYYEYSSPILEVGIEQAYKNMGYNYDKFLKRGGLYSW